MKQKKDDRGFPQEDLEAITFFRNKHIILSDDVLMGSGVSTQLLFTCVIRHPDH
jgi:hypothetical protein